VPHPRLPRQNLLHLNHGGAAARDQRLPAAFITVGNADPLRQQSRAFADVLRENEVDLDPLFHEDDHRPLLGHEYQFDLDLADGWTAFDRMVVFVKGRVGLS
jgi:acetyl esterase/lipase